MKTYKVNEIFCSIQGEGSQTGQSMIFVRFSGCDMSCPFCDTDHSHFTEMTAKQIAEQCSVLLTKKKPWYPLPICFTGGEPTLQVDKELYDAFLGRGFDGFHMETNGNRRCGVEDLLDHITISPKQRPHLIDSEMLDLLMTGRLRSKLDLKIVWDESNPDLPALIQEWGSLPFNGFFIQPLTVSSESGSLMVNLPNAVQYVLDHPWWRMSIQMHKMIGVK